MTVKEASSELFKQYSNNDEVVAIGIVADDAIMVYTLHKYGIKDLPTSYKGYVLKQSYMGKVKPQSV